MNAAEEAHGVNEHDGSEAVAQQPSEGSSGGVAQANSSPPHHRTYEESIASFESKWKQLQGLFDEMNNAMGRALSQPGFISALSGGGPPSDGSESLSASDKAAVFMGQPPSLDAVCDGIRSGKYGKIVVACGAGISTSAGIPDFRSPGTGMFSKMAEEEAARAASQEGAASPPSCGSVEEQMSIKYYSRDPTPALRRWATLWPNQGFRPTPAHVLLTALHDRGLLLRVFTQNIDSLELEAGLPHGKVVQAHGHLREVHCSECRRKLETPEAYDDARCTMMKGEGVRCPACGNGWLKPAIVLFGEPLTGNYTARSSEDLKACDLLIVMGTSLLVAPFAHLPLMCRPTVPRVLINRDLVGCFTETCGAEGKGNYRDVAVLGSIDDGCAQIAAGIGCSAEFADRCAQMGCRVMPERSAVVPSAAQNALQPAKTSTAAAPPPRTASCRTSGGKGAPPPKPRGHHHQLPSTHRQ